MNSPDIKSAKVMEDYHIHLIFDNGEQKVFDLKPYLDYQVFRPLNDEAELKSFEIVDGTVEWSCGADLSTDTFYLESKPIQKDSVI